MFVCIAARSVTLPPRVSISRNETTKKKHFRILLSTASIISTNATGVYGTSVYFTIHRTVAAAASTRLSLERACDQCALRRSPRGAISLNMREGLHKSVNASFLFGISYFFQCDGSCCCCCSRGCHRHTPTSVVSMMTAATMVAIKAMW